jgi:ATP-binding cassette subfamily F protein 3
MSLLSLKDIEKSYGARPVLKGVSFVLNPGDRAGLVGANGSGKTTLLDIISGEMKPDSGEVASAKGLRVGYLAQEAVPASGVTLIDEMLSARPEVLNLRHRLDDCARDVSRLASEGGTGYELAIVEYGRLLEEFESSGGYAYDNAVTGALIGLGFVRDDFTRELSTLSGGQMTRLKLAKLLLAGHGLLMLDEPTNHLDVPAIAWLEGFLREYKGTALIVSHDRYFLDRVATRILELDGGKVEQYPGNFSVYIIEKEKRTADRLRQYDLAAARLEKEKEYINRMRAGVHARQAKGREKRLDRLTLPDRPSATDRRHLQMKWTEVTRSSDMVLKADGISKVFGDKEILKDVSFTIRRGERIGVVGRNGEGKSTLIKIIMGALDPDSGDIQLGLKVKPAYYAQGLEGLTETNTVLEELWGVKPLAVEQEIRDMLGVFLFRGDDAMKKVINLSGGEKGRLAISKVVLAGANLLILDEPTNHLDIPSREALEAALAGFSGTVLAVSHDRFFLDMFAEKIFEVQGGALSVYLGNYTRYSEKKVADEVEEREQAEGRQAWEERKQRQALEKKREKDLTRKAEKIQDIENEIEDLEVKLKETEEKLSDNSVYDNFNKVMELTECYNILKAKRDKLYDLLEREVS